MLKRSAGSFSALGSSLNLLRPRSGHSRGLVTGLRIGPDFMEWTVLREAKSGAEILSSGRGELAAAGAAAPAPSRAEQIKQYGLQLKGAVAVGLAPDKILMRVAELPSTDPAEILKMIQLQVDAFSPFPDERMFVSYEVLASKASATLVFITAVQKELIEETGAALKAAGLDVQRIDAEILAWRHLLSGRVAFPEQGRLLILVLEPAGGAWIVFQERQPLAFRAVSAPDNISAEEYAVETARDAGNFLLSIDLEHGSAPLAGIEIWPRGIDPRPLAAAIKEEFQHEVKLQSLDSLAPLSEGLARRFLGTLLSSALTRVREGQAVLDLVPQAWRSVIIVQRLRRRLIAATIGVLALWVLAMTAFIGLYQFQKYRLTRLETGLRGLQEPEKEVIQMQNQVKSFEQYLDRRSSALECLREVSRSLTKDVLLTSFQFKKGKSVVIRGEALAVNAIYDYKKALDQSPLFSKVEMGAVKPGKRKEINIQTFQMTAKLKEQP